MRRISLSIVCVGLLVTGAIGQEPESRPGVGATTKPVSPDARIQALIAEYDADKRGYPVKFAKFKPRIEAFAEKHRGSDAGLEAELWLFSGCWWSRKDGTMNAKAAVVADRILANYKESKNLGKMMDLVYVFSARQKAEYGLRLLKASSRPEVQAAVHLALGKLYLRSRDEARRQESHEHFQLLAKKYADLSYRSTTYGAMAHAFLNPHKPEALAVDKVAPEIVGTGIDGKPMKLSDYRGKVVVLDFWGDW